MSSFYPHPKIDLAATGLTGEDLEIAAKIVNTHTGQLRASKPNDPYAAYVWRMVAFYVSPDPKLQCMPVTADWGIPWDERESMIPRLDAIVDKITDSIPARQWHGVARWGRALGML